MGLGITGIVMTEMHALTIAIHAATGLVEVLVLGIVIAAIYGG